MKASKFRCLRGIETSVVNRLLSEVKDCELSLRELSSECTSIKQLQKVQATFVKGTNTTSWEDAQHQFPQYATSSQLEPFRKLHFTGPTLPDAFMHFCQRVVATVATNKQENAEEMNVLECDDPTENHFSFLLEA